MAGLITHNFSVTIIPGSSFAGVTGTGSVTYDDILSPGQYFGSIFDLEIDILGLTFTNMNDFDFPGFPGIEIDADLNVSILELAVANGVNGVDFGALNIDFLFFGGLQFNNGEYALFANAVESTPVSAPATLSMVCLATVGLVLFRRKIR